RRLSSPAISGSSSPSSAPPRPPATSPRLGSLRPCAGRDPSLAAELTGPPAELEAGQDRACTRGVHPRPSDQPLDVLRLVSHQQSQHALLVTAFRRRRRLDRCDAGGSHATTPRIR